MPLVASRQRINSDSAIPLPLALSRALRLASLKPKGALQLKRPFNRMGVGGPLMSRCAAGQSLGPMSIIEVNAQ